MKTKLITLVLLFIAPALFGHVRVRPADSKLGATETYTLRVPSERGRTTTSVILSIPEGVTIVSVAIPPGVPNISFQQKPSADGRPQVSWTLEIKPGEAAELSFVAQNPTAGSTIIWKVQQKYSDGTVSDWTGPKGDKTPAATTSLGVDEKK